MRILATGLVLLVLSLSGISPASAQTRATTKVGDVHVYTGQNKTDRTSYEETVIVTAIEGGKIRTKHSRPGRAEDIVGIYDTEWNTEQSGGSGLRYEPLFRAMSFPLEPGKKWQTSSEFSTSNGARTKTQGDIRVVGMEKVKTAAGEFDAVRLENKGYLSGVSWQGGWAYTQTYWYAPSIDRLVKFEHKESRTLGAESVLELKSFKPAP